MRKVIYTTTINPQTFEPFEVCKIKLDDGEILTVFNRELKEEKFTYLGKEFSEKELNIINSVNEALKAIELVELTVEEAYYMFNWNKIPDIKDPESLQKLSGFTVEKTIKPFGVGHNSKISVSHDTEIFNTGKDTRQTFYIDVGNASPEEAKETLHEIHNILKENNNG